MPIYILKRYYNVVPSDDDVWHLARETAFHAVSDQRAITHAQKQNVSDLTPHGGLTILFDPRGRRLWECLFERGAATVVDSGTAAVQLEEGEQNRDRNYSN